MASGYVVMGSGALQACASDPTFPEPDARPVLRIPGTLATSDAILSAGAAELDLNGETSRAWGYNGAIPGPTLRARVGQHARIRVLNQLTEDTTVHWHGMVVPAAMDGHPGDAIRAGGEYAYAFPIKQRPTMNWYHPHPHGGTGRQAWRGMAGAFIIEDPVAEQRLPGGDRTIPLLLRDGLLDGSGQLEYRRRNSGLVGDFPIVNGVPYPGVTLVPTIYRLRILNAANVRVFAIVLSNGRPFTLIGNDGGLLEAPVDVSEIELGNAERVDVLVDLSGEREGARLSLRCRRAGWDLLDIHVSGERDDRGPVPAAFAPIPRLPVSAATRRRRFRFESHRRINGREYRMDRIDFAVPRGEVEIWEFESDGGAPHPIHVHGASFQIVSRRGGRNRLYPWEQGWKDTVLLHDDERVEVAIRFDEYAGIYLLHCHKLEHEDAGMMLNFEVT